MHVNWLRLVFTTVLLALWLPAANHCKLEQFPALAFAPCCPEDAPESQPASDCETDGCALVEESFYKAEDAQTHFVPVLVTVRCPAPETQVVFVAQAPVISPPPELPVRWQFIQRSALQPRAPSLVS